MTKLWFVEYCCTLFHNEAKLAPTLNMDADKMVSDSLSMLERAVLNNCYAQQGVSKFAIYT